MTDIPSLPAPLSGAAGRSLETGAPLRTPPRNIEVEAALLGAILRDNRVFEKVGDLLRPEYFSAPEHQRLYRSIAKLINAGQEARPTTLQHMVQDDPLLQAAGGADYLYELAANVMTVINARNYAQIVQDLHLKRELIGLGETMVNTAYDLTDSDLTGEKQIEAAEHALYRLATEGAVERAILPLREAARLALESAEKAFKKESHVVGVTTGFKPIDALLGGLHPSDLIILAGRPAMGKTALATTIAFNAASRYRKFRDENGAEIEEGGKVLFFSLEMSAEQLAGRLLSGQARLSSDRIRRGEINHDEFQRVITAAQSLAEIPLYIDDTPALTISGLRQRARRIKRSHGLNLVVVDYLQLLHGPPDRPNENRVQEVSEITRGLKALAKELNAPVLALSQLSRQVEQREDKHPQLSDLRESGSIEQDSDVVAFVYRQEYYLKQMQPEQRAAETVEKFQERVAQHNQRLRDAANTAKVIIAKQRHGPVGVVDLFFDADYARFGDPIDRTHSRADLPPSYGKSIPL